ncbi:MAG: hypothetical protein M1820_008182 [Bogoriella megaspora]|nr:MAG: hypothetical protein M1820_008182 [Bogoriella megaspora]
MTVRSLTIPAPSLRTYNDHIEKLRLSEFPLLNDSNPSVRAGARIDHIRERALRFFNADPEHFDLVFLANATAAVKLVANAFQDASSDKNPSNFWFGWHYDAHTSLVGVRELTDGNHECFYSDQQVQKWIEAGAHIQKGSLGLFAYPGQSNMTGRRLPLSWPGQIRRAQTRRDELQKVYTLLDAAALATTTPIDLSDPSNAPDFTCLSFYKIFGFPDLGALIVRKSSSHILCQRKYFGGGTVEMVISLSPTWHAKKSDNLHDACEDGTLPFHSILALGHALDVHRELFGSMQIVSAHTSHLVRTLYDSLLDLRHYNSRALCRFYNEPSATYGDPSTQGATLALNILRPDGSLVGYTDVQHAANELNVYVRSGSLCNPGGMATYLGWSPEEMRAAYGKGHRCDNPIQIIEGKATGVVRCSFGASSTLSDVYRFVEFMRDTYMRHSSKVKGMIEDATSCRPNMKISECGDEDVEKMKGS